MSSMLEQAIIDADQLKETAKKTAEEAVIEKYQTEIKEAVEKILEQDDLAMEEENDDAALVPDGEGGLDLVEDLPSAQLAEDDVIDIDLNKLEEMMEEELENGGLEADDMVSREELAEKIDEEIEISEEELQEALDSEIEIDEADLASVIAEMLSEDAISDSDKLEGAEAAEQAAEEGGDEAEDLTASGKGLEEAEELAEEKEEKLAAQAGDPEEVEKEDFENLKKGTRYTESKKSDMLQKENKTLLKEQKKLGSKVQLLEKKLDKYGTVIVQLKDKLNESNLTNAKLLYQNRILNSVSLNERQKDQIVEAISNATTVEEAKIIFETLQSAVGFKVKKSKKQESLNEVVTRSSSAFIPRKEAKSKANNAFNERMKILAGLK